MDEIKQKKEEYLQKFLDDVEKLKKEKEVKSDNLGNTKA